MLSLLASTLLTGCVTSPNGDGTGTDVTALAQSLPQVKAFLEQYPNAKITVALWDSTSVEKNIATIRADCGEQFAVADYYKVTLTDPSLSLIVWLDKSTQEPVCAVKGSIGLVPTSTPAVTSVLPSDFQLEYTSTPAAGLVGYSFIEQVNVSANGVASYYYSGHAVVPDAEPTVKSSKVQLSAAQQTELLAAINRADFFNMPPKATCEGKEICGIRTGGASNQVLYIVADGKKNTVTAEAELNDAFDKIVYLAVTAAQENPDPIVTASPVVPSDFKAHYEAGGYQLAGYDVTDIFANGTAFTYDYSGSSAPIVAEYYVSKQNMEKIYREIISDGFFSLKDSYRDSSIMDGGWYSLAITVSGKTKTVKASNTKVSQVIQIHDLMESSLENLETPPMPFGPTATPSTEDLTCVSAGKPIYASQPGSKCCDGLVFNKLSGSASYGISGHCAYPAPTVAPGCKWVAIECSQYGAYWSGKPIECNKENEGKVGMGPSGNLGGAYIPESYTSEKWDSCFTPRAMCSCGNVVVPTVTPPVTPTAITQVTVSNNPWSVAFTPNGKYAYVVSVDETKGSVSVIDTASKAVVKKISIKRSNSALPNTPHGLAISPDGKYAYVVNEGPGTVSVIDTATNTAVNDIVVGNSPSAVAISPDGTYAYVGNTGDDTISVFNTATHTVIDTIPVGNDIYFSIAFAPNGAYAYVANSFFNRTSYSISVVNTATRTVVKNITVGGSPSGVAVTPNGALVYVTNENDNTVSVIDTSTNSVIKTIPVGSYPIGVAVSPDGAYAYVANFGDGTVSTISTATNAVVRSTRVGKYPLGLAISPDNSYAYVTNEQGSVVYIVGTETLNTPLPTVTCPQYTTPAPGWCAKGTIIPAVMDSKGCYGPPSCVYPTPTSIPGVDCKELWWFDNTRNTACQQSRFCGAFMYYGLRTFATKDECIAALPNATVTPAPTITCIDTDGGKDYYVAGNATTYGGAAYDCCTSGMTNGVCIQSGPVVKEGYCSNNLLGAVLFACPFGCSNGACINATPTATPEPTITPTITPVPTTNPDYWVSTSPFAILNYKVNSTSILFVIQNRLGDDLNLTDIDAVDGSGNSVKLLTLNRSFVSGEEVLLSNYSFLAGNPCNASGQVFVFPILSFSYAQGSITGIRQQGAQPFVGICSP